MFELNFLKSVNSGSGPKRCSLCLPLGRKAVAQSIERSTPGHEVVSSIPAPGVRSLHILGRCQYNDM